METEGWETEDGSQEPGTGNNVVPFPRDWLGPREELIPFGSRAGHSSKEGSSAPGAEAFWGGDSGPLHAVLPALPGGPGAGSAATGAAGWRSRSRASRLAAAGLAAAGLAAAVLAAAVFGRLAGVPTNGSSRAVGSNVAAAGFMDLALLRGAVGMPDIKSSKPAVHKPVRRARTVARPKRHAQSAAASSSSGVPAAQTSESRSTSSAGTPATSTTGTSATSTSTPVSSGSTSTASSEPAATSTAPTHSSVSSHAASVRAGPVGPGAPFGPGQLK